MMETLKEVLMRRDGMTEDEAEDAIFDAKEQLQEYLETGDIEAAEEICASEFGLEPDYIHELID